MQTSNMAAHCPKLRCEGVCVRVCIRVCVCQEGGECRHDRNRKWIEEDDSSILSSASEEL
jgi:hypothetical protein